jgi:hypothetical protein
VGNGGTLVQVGGNWKGVSVAVGSTKVGGTLMGRIPTGNNWLGRINTAPKTTTIPKVPMRRRIVSKFQIDIFIAA